VLAGVLAAESADLLDAFFTARRGASPPRAGDFGRTPPVR
jgi:hypothetical protein